LRDVELKLLNTQLNPDLQPAPHSEVNKICQKMETLDATIKSVMDRPARTMTNDAGDMLNRRVEELAGCISSLKGQNLGSNPGPESPRSSSFVIEQMVTRARVEVEQIILSYPIAMIPIGEVKRLYTEVVPRLNEVINKIMDALHKESSRTSVDEILKNTEGVWAAGDAWVRDVTNLYQLNHQHFIELPKGNPESDLRPFSDNSVQIVVEFLAEFEAKFITISDNKKRGKSSIRTTCPRI